MFTQKPYAAFGYVLIKNTYPVGFTISSVVNAESVCTLFCTKGRINLILEETDAPLDLVPGTFITPEQYIFGTYNHTTISDSDVWCFDPKMNRNFTPDIRKFHLPQNSSQILPQGTKLFLCGGTATVNDKQINKPTQLLIRTSNTQITSTTDCYGLIFE